MRVENYMLDNVTALLRAFTTQQFRLAPGKQSKPSISDVMLKKKLAESDYIEAYFTTFKQVIRDFRSNQSKGYTSWSPNLRATVQQAYFALPASDARDYEVT